MNDPGGVSRRRALGLLAGAGVATAASACSSSSSNPSQRRTPPTAPPSPSAARTAQHSDWRSLGRRLSGDVLLPQDTGFHQAGLLFDRRFDGVTPTVIAHVANAADVVACVDFARRFHLPVRLRSGGHSYIGASGGPGFVIDLRAMNSVSAGSGAATIGTGAALIDVYNSLAAHGVSIPAGSCPSVGISGLTLGGGVGVVGRRYGLTCDRLVEAQVVTADGDIVTCSGSKQPDLFWALRGGGGSFGVVTALRLETHPADPLAHAYVTWPWPAAADVVAAWQRWAVDVPASLWSSAHVVATETTGAPTLSVAAVMVDSTAALQQQIGGLTQAVRTAPTTNFVTSEGYAATMMLEAGCSTRTVTECHIADETPGGTLSRDAFVAGSDFFRDPIPPKGISALVQAVEQRQRDPRLGAGGASFDILGGAIDKPATDATAWSHRGALFNAQYTASWGNQPGNGPLARNQHSLATIHGTLRRYATGEAYQNYADDSLTNPQQAYYGANLAKLIDVRRTYDPTGMFTQPQGVPLA
jgi:FAD/FMN-containing dehydrogenase